MEIAIQLLLATLGKVIPAITSSSAISAVISGLSQVIPLVLQEVRDITPIYNNIKQAISELKTKSTLTPEDIAALKALDKMADDMFEAAAVPQPGDPDYSPVPGQPGYVKSTT